MHQDLDIIATCAITSLWVSLMRVNRRLASPVLTIVNRWLRWVFMAIGPATLATRLEFIDRPFWAVAIGCFLLWFLGETINNWMYVHAESVSPLPLFPRFSANTSGEEWPTNARFLRIRDWLRNQQFKHVQALRAEIGPGIYLRASVYQDAKAETRIEVSFLPLPNRSIAVCYSISSQTVSGFRYVTDNLYLHFGGFYPENWLVERKPLCRSLNRLLVRHRQRLTKANEMILPWDVDPVTDLNSQQRELEQVNTELGFLMPHAERDDYGKLSYEGRYRVWKELWLLNYFGRSARYE